MDQTLIIEEIKQERQRQDAKWGEQNHDPFLYMSILGEEYGEACQAALHSHFGSSDQDDENVLNFRQEMVQVAAVAVAIIECIDRDKWTWGNV